MHHTVPVWFKFIFTLPVSLKKGILFIVQGLPVKAFLKQAKRMWEIIHADLEVSRDSRAVRFGGWGL